MMWCSASIRFVTLLPSLRLSAHCLLQVFLTHTAFHKLEDYLRTSDVEEMKRNRIRDAEAEAGLDPRGTSDPYAPYATPGSEGHGPSSPGEAYGDPFNQSSQALPLV